MKDTFKSRKTVDITEEHLVPTGQKCHVRHQKKWNLPVERRGFYNKKGALSIEIDMVSFWQHLKFTIEEGDLKKAKKIYGPFAVAEVSAIFH